MLGLIKKKSEYRKPEEKKPRWQPPKRDDDRLPHNDAKDRHVSSPRKEHELYQGPKRNNSGSGSPAPSPKKTHAPAPPPVTQEAPPAKPPRAQSPVRGSPVRPPAAGSPKKSTHTVQLSQPASTASPKFTHHVSI